jgi:hypothetical protein
MPLVSHTKILTLFSFLRLKSPDIYWYQWIYPTLTLLIGYGFYWVIGSKVLEVQQHGLISDVNDLMGILVGFYIAALAAISSFTNESLDQSMKGRAPTLSHFRQQQTIVEQLTRRRFLSILFGYCASVSIVLYVFGVLQAHVSVSPDISGWLLVANNSANLVGWSIYLWFLSSLLVVTLLGLHYLIDRMHRS